MSFFDTAIIFTGGFAAGYMWRHYTTQFILAKVTELSKKYVYDFEKDDIVNPSTKKENLANKTIFGCEDQPKDRTIPFVTARGGYFKMSELATHNSVNDDAFLSNTVPLHAKALECVD